ncbi:aminotransferase class I/II-fold pyridoxal phosphate-dependent enzyme [Chryseobacterium sp. 3008163]|uniref:aminotransferase class I/II-fold pyridoxal phosphate-dependent enzyme n=1 Tax=Chryseobacterium sp. 3008163 TaxID=2478663 RepID=UPI000F0C52BA|nr:pyridoxal phosphate-dependent aminotransferase family protein [Chryseobacterium sp. 3008163]AYN02059.1 pyridoxal phosphate-dependent aminotransferase family protein [Chryseobacterium sp. 3008163]
MLKNFHYFQEALDKREEEGTLRVLKPQSVGIDFYSNDYLGFAQNKELQNLLVQQVMDNPHLLSGSTGSRLISGNSSEVVKTEKLIAKEHQYSDALLFSSGYNANLALFSTLPTRHDTIIVDEKIHRSVHDACKMSHAKKIKFSHNDVGDLENILKRQNGKSYIAIESLYSMDGDFAPIQEIAEVAEKYDAYLIVDEAHSFGVFGNGLVDQFQLQKKILATVITYGKALGSHGAAILCNDVVKSYLVNFASPFIYTTSAQDIQWRSIKIGYEFLKENDNERIKLQQNIEIFRQQNLKSLSSAKSPIQAILISDHDRLNRVKQTLSDEGFLTYAVFSPAVKEGAERLRICLHSFNTEEEILKLTKIIKEFI